VRKKAKALTPIRTRVHTGVRPRALSVPCPCPTCTVLNLLPPCVQLVVPRCIVAFLLVVVTCEERGRVCTSWYGSIVRVTEVVTAEAEATAFVVCARTFCVMNFFFFFFFFFLRSKGKHFYSFAAPTGIAINNAYYR
jgi:hypothetical protein